MRQVPADAWVIEGEGLTVYPGLIDALSTVGMPGAAPAAAATRWTRRRARAECHHHRDHSSGPGASRDGSRGPPADHQLGRSRG